MKRRDFIKNTALTAAAAPLFLNGLRIQAHNNEGILGTLNTENDRILVIIQLQGGNDGLNTVIPISSFDHLANHRPNIMIPEATILGLDATTGLHPSMTGFKSLWDNAKMSIVHSVAYPNLNRSHFRSTDIWTTASSATEIKTTGWLGRHFSAVHPNYPNGYPNAEYPHPIAISMGAILSETCQGMGSNFSTSILDPFNLTFLAETPISVSPNEPYGQELVFLQQSVSNTNSSNTSITEAINGGANNATYPDTNLAFQLKNVARLISGGLNTKVYVCNIGGFDTHSSQTENNTTLGKHAELLTALSDAVAAFQQDLAAQNLEHRVVGMTFSEFGRQIASNASDGTDHGTAAPLFLFGACIKQGMVGETPEIPATIEPIEGVGMQFDFRDIYGSLLIDWFEVSQADVQNLLYPEFQYTSLLLPCLTPVVDPPPVDTVIPELCEAEPPKETDNTTGTKTPVHADLCISPNPVHDIANITFYNSTTGHVRLRVFGSLGQVVATLVNKTCYAGDHTISFPVDHLPAGNYYCQLNTPIGSKTKILVKV